jgi:hypothetical protein
MSDLLDVLHVMFEDDQLPKTDDERRGRDGMRRALYVDMYGYPEYAWALPPSSQNASAGSGDSAYTRGMIDRPVDMSDPSAATLTHKPYTPPTMPLDPDAPLPFGSILDAPLG